MGVPRFLLGLFRQAPKKGQLLRSLALGSQGGDFTVTSTDGTSLSTRQTGEGTPVVLVHGTLDGIGSFSFVELQLAERYDVWIYDRRGRGGSTDADDYTLDREVDDLRAVMAATGAMPHVVGHSYGAVIALQAAMAGVEMRSLVAYEPPMNSDAVPEARVDEIRRAVDEGRTDDAIAMMARDLAGVSDDELSVAMSVPPVRKHLRDGVRTAARELEAIRTCDWGGLPLTDVPTLVLRGERNTSDAYPTTEQAADIATDVEIATLAGQGHLGQTFAPSAFADSVLTFLDQH